LNVPSRVEPESSASSAALLPDHFLEWFAARGWSPREHQLALLAKAREDRSALLIAPTGAGKTLAGFLPTLVELSSFSSSARSAEVRPSPLPPRSGGEGSGVGGVSANSRSPVGTDSAEAPPTPDPPPPRATRVVGGEQIVAGHNNPPPPTLTEVVTTLRTLGKTELPKQLARCTPRPVEMRL